MIAAPTSSGKTTIFELGYLRMIRDHERLCKEEPPSIKPPVVQTDPTLNGDKSDEDKVAGDKSAKVASVGASQVPLAIYMAPTKVRLSSRQSTDCRRYVANVHVIGKSVSRKLEHVSSVNEPIPDPGIQITGDDNNDYSLHEKLKNVPLLVTTVGRVPSTVLSVAREIRLSHSKFEIRGCDLGAFGAGHD